MSAANEMACVAPSASDGDAPVCRRARGLTTEAALGRGSRSSNSRHVRPNYFLALQVSQSAETVAAIRTVQHSILANAPQLRDAILPPVTAHLTLVVMYLEEERKVNNKVNAELSDEVGNQDGDGPEEPSRAANSEDDGTEADGKGLSSDNDKQKAENHNPAVTDGMQALEDARAALESAGLLRPVKVTFKGLSNFRHRVLFLDVAKGPEFDHIVALSKSLQTHFTSCGIPPLDDRFTPHVTVAKLSKMKSFGRKSGKRKRKKGMRKQVGKELLAGAKTEIECAASVVKPAVQGSGEAKQLHERDGIVKRIPEECYQEHVEIDGGTVVVNEIQLCKMAGRKDDEYYHVVKSIELGS